MALSVWQRTITDEAGNVRPGAVLQITLEETSALATVYKDRDGTDPWPPGTVTADSFGFARFYAPRGRYRIQSLAPAIDWRDVEIGFQDTDQLQVGDGSEGAPAIAFGGSVDGFYRGAPGRVDIATAGTHRATFDANGLTVPERVRAGDGTVSEPAFGFHMQGGLGFYRLSSHTIGIATNGGQAGEIGLAGAKFKVGGVQTFDIAEDRVESTVPIRTPNGSASRPSHSFAGDTDTGVFLVDSNALGFATGGTSAGRINADQSVSFGSSPLASNTHGQLSVSVLGGEAPKFALHRTGATIWQLAITGTTGTAGLDVQRQNVQHFRFNTSHFIPLTDADKTLGGSGNRWTVVFATTGTINTSDAREKTELEPLTEAEIAAAKELAGAVGSYRWLDAIQAKGEDGARTHIGITVQRVIEIMQGHGLDPFRYAFVCYDEWEEEATEIEDPEGEIVRTERRQLTERHTVTREEIEIIDGEPRLVTREETVEVPRVEMRPVVDAEGKIATRRREIERADGKGEAQRETVDEPVMHPVPVMGDVEVRYRREVITAAGDRYGLRYDELAMFIARGLEARLAALESGATRK